MMQIIDSTDGQFIGLIFDPEQPLMLSGSEFAPDAVKLIGDGMFRFSNSNYVLDVKEI